MIRKVGICLYLSVDYRGHVMEGLYSNTAFLKLESMFPRFWNKCATICKHNSGHILPLIVPLTIFIVCKDLVIEHTISFINTNNFLRRQNDADFHARVIYRRDSIWSILVTNILTIGTPKCSKNVL